MNSPKQLFYLSVPQHLHRNKMPDMLVKVETTIRNNKVDFVEFIPPSTMDLINVTDWNELFEVACDKAEELWAQNSCTAIGTITDANSIMPGILASMNTTQITEKVKSN